MQIREYIDNVCDQIRYKPIRNEIAEELIEDVQEAAEGCPTDAIKIENN